jgi:metal transporter CNNM
VFVLTNIREIIDESDVFIDVHKAIRRMAPAPRTRAPKGAVVMDATRKPSEAPAVDGETDTEQNGGARKMSMPEQSDNLRPATFMLRRRSTGNKSSDPLRSDDPEVMKHLKHLGPSNAANRPKSTRINTVKIKPGQINSLQPEIPTTIPEYSRPPSQGVLAHNSHAPEGGIGEGLLSSAAGEASDGVHSLAVGYGTMTPGTGAKNTVDDAISPGTQPTYAEVVNENGNGKNNSRSRERSHSHSTIGSLHSGRSRSRSPPKKRTTARSGSISENIIDVNGVKKIVLETTSSSDSEDKLANSQTDGAEDSRQHSEAESQNANKGGESKKKRKKRGKKKNKGGNSSESQPLLGNQ